MARFTATFSITEVTDWEEGDFFTEQNFKEQVGQNIEWFAQSHDHSGDAGDGGTLGAADDGLVWFAQMAVD